MTHTEQRHRKALIFLWALLPFLMAFALLMGRYPVPLSALADWATGQLAPTISIVLTDIRLPRILLSMLVGGAISVSGCVYQGVFQNMMASPDLLGASTGAALGATFGILLGWGAQWVTTLAFLGGSATLVLVWMVSRHTRTKPTMGLILSGIMISALCQSAISVLKLLADPLDQLPAITYWMMGSLAGADYSQVVFLALCMVIALVPLLTMRWQLNVLALGDTQAQALGIPVKKLRTLALICATLLTAGAISISGIIGWIGLVVPYFARRLVGNGYQYLLPTCLGLGMAFLLCTDTLARTLCTIELPLGILTSFVGAPFFLWLMMGKHGGGL